MGIPSRGQHVAMEARIIKCVVVGIDLREAMHTFGRTAKSTRHNNTQGNTPYYSPEHTYHKQNDKCIDKSNIFWWTH